MVQDAHAALTDSRSRNAEQAFSQALALLETCTPKVMVLLWFSEVNAAHPHSSSPHLIWWIRPHQTCDYICQTGTLLLSQDFGLSNLDVLLLYYGRASALTEIGRPEVTPESTFYRLFNLLTEQQEH